MREPKSTQHQLLDTPEKPPRDSAELIVRWGLFAIGAGMLAASFVFRFQPELLPRGGRPVAELLARVGIVLLAAWFAWPGIIAARRTPGGLLVLVLGIATLLMFVVRPKSLLLMGPLFGILAAGVSILSWFRRMR